MRADVISLAAERLRRRSRGVAEPAEDAPLSELAALCADVRAELETWPEPFRRRLGDLADEWLNPEHAAPEFHALRMLLRDRTAREIDKAAQVVWFQGGVRSYVELPELRRSDPETARQVAARHEGWREADKQLFLWSLFAVGWRKCDRRAMRALAATLVQERRQAYADAIKPLRDAVAARGDRLARGLTRRGRPFSERFRASLERALARDRGRLLEAHRRLGAFERLIEREPDPLRVLRVFRRPGQGWGG